MDSNIYTCCIQKFVLYIMDVPQQMSAIINQVTDKSVRGVAADGKQLGIW